MAAFFLLDLSQFVIEFYLLQMKHRNHFLSSVIHQIVLNSDSSMMASVSSENSIPMIAWKGHEC